MPGCSRNGEHPRAAAPAGMHGACTVRSAASAGCSPHENPTVDLAGRCWASRSCAPEPALTANQGPRRVPGGGTPRGTVLRRSASADLHAGVLQSVVGPGRGRTGRTHDRQGAASERYVASARRRGRTKVEAITVGASRTDVGEGVWGVRSDGAVPGLRLDGRCPSPRPMQISASTLTGCHAVPPPLIGSHDRMAVGAVAVVVEAFVHSWTAGGWRHPLAPCRERGTAPTLLGLAAAAMSGGTPCRCRRRSRR